MPQAIQLVPKYSFPYVETYVNDNTVVTDVDNSANTNGDNNVYYAFAFTSPKGIDNKFIKINSQDVFQKTYGKSNYKKYGQPLMMPYHVLESPYSTVWCMRVMPENATYSHNVISAFFKADEKKDGVDASKRKFRLKFVQKQSEVDSDNTIYTKEDLSAFANVLDGSENDSGNYVDGEGYTQIPGILTIRAIGRGDYGDKYSVRISRSLYHEKEWGIKMYAFEVLSTENGLQKVAEYVGSPVTSEKYTETTYINDVIDDVDEGTIPADVRLDEDKIDQVYDAFVTFCTELLPELEEEYETKITTYAIPEGMVEGTVPVTEAYVEKVTEIRDLLSKIENCKNIPSRDEFDIFFGYNLAANTKNPFIEYPAKLTSDVDTDDPDYDASDYTTSDVVFLDAVQGIKMSNGTNGYLDKPRIIKITDPVTMQEVDKQWTVEEEIEDCYKKAWSGSYDKRILSSKRIKVSAFFDANYPLSVKYTIADLVLLRKDSIFYADAGLTQTLSSDSLNALIDDFANFTEYKLDKNIGCYQIKEPTSKKKCMVTITYRLARNYVDHVINNGVHIPMVNEYCQLTGHIKNSLVPSIDDYEYDLKEKLYTNRFNYFETVDDNLYQRSTQNTSQVLTSDLLEENNVGLLLELKNGVEREISTNLYNFADAEERRRLNTNVQDKYRSWIGTRVQSIEVEFKVSQFEQERSIVHAYLGVVFRPLAKRAILEIDINKREYAEDEEE